MRVREKLLKGGKQETWTTWWLTASFNLRFLNLWSLSFKIYARRSIVNLKPGVFGMFVIMRACNVESRNEVSHYEWYLRRQMHSAKETIFRLSCCERVPPVKELFLRGVNSFLWKQRGRVTRPHSIKRTLFTSEMLIIMTVWRLIGDI